MKLGSSSYAFAMMKRVKQANFIYRTNSWLSRLTSCKYHLLAFVCYLCLHLSWSQSFRLHCNCLSLIAVPSIQPQVLQNTVNCISCNSCQRKQMRRETFLSFWHLHFSLSENYLCVYMKGKICRD